MKNKNTNSTHDLKHYASLVGVFAGFVALAFFAQFGFSNLAAQAQTTGPVARQITPHVIYNDLPVEQTLVISGQNLRGNQNWDLSTCALQETTLSDEEFLVGYRISGGSIVTYQSLGIAQYDSSTATSDLFRLVIPANQSNSERQLSEFYITKCYTSGSEVNAPWRVSIPVSSSDDDIELADPVRITSPVSGNQIVEGSSTTIATQVRTSLVGNVGDPLQVDYYLETISGVQYYLGNHSGFNLQAGGNSISFPWSPAGYDTNDNGPLLGFAKIRAVVTIVNKHAIGNVLSGQFEVINNPLNNTLIDIIEPTANSVIYWGAKNVDIKFRASDDVTAVSIELTKGGSLNDPNTYSVVLDANCATVPNQDLQTCTVDFPNPDNVEDGPGFSLIVNKIGGIGLNSDIQLVEMRSVPQDLYFDTNQGIKGFEFSPLVTDPNLNQEVEVSVLVRFDSNISGNSVTGFMLEGTAGFGTAGDRTRIEDINIEFNGTILANQTVSIPLGTFTTNGTIWNYNLTVDSQNDIAEGDETNNTIFGEFTGNNPGIDTSTLGSTLYLGIDNPSLKLGQKLSSGFVISQGEIPANTLVGTILYTVEYDPSMLSPDTDSFAPASGVIIEKFDASTPGVLFIEVKISATEYPKDFPFTFATLNWNTLNSGTTNISLSSITKGLAGDGNDVFLQDRNGVALLEYGDVLRNVTGNASTIIIGSALVKPLAATYTSRYLPVSDTVHRITGLVDFAAVYNDAVSPDPEFTSRTTFRIGFFDQNKNNLCVGNCSPGFINQFYEVSVSESYNPATEEGIVPLDQLNNLIQNTWTNQVKYLRVQVVMETSNHYADPNYQPWVEDIYLNYDSESLGEIGLISSTTGVVNIAPGESTTYDFTVNLFNEPTFIGTVTWNVSLDQQGTDDVVVTPVGSTTMTFDGTNPIQSGTVLVAVSPEALAGLNNYTFSITAITSDDTKTIRPLQNIQVNVLGDSTSEFSIQVVPANTTGAVGSSVEFTVTAIRQTGFTDAIQITDNIQTIFGNDIETVTYQPGNAIIPANSNGPVTITALISPTAAFGTKDFTITGESNGINSGTTISLTISDGSDLKNATFTLNIPIQGGNDGIQPIFSFFLYSADNSKIFEKTDIKTENQTATVNVNGLTIGGVYKSFVRSTRHLWRESDNTVTITASESNYTFNFTQLLAGDLDPNNVINAIDVPVLTRDWGKTGQGLIPDIDGNGAVNALDIVAIFSNYFKSGDQLPANQ
ncbi:MAG: hypothetical protein R3B38_02965 [Patescibacteria group bacterium]